MRPDNRVTTCECCGTGKGKGTVERVEVVRRHPETDPVVVEALALCEACRTTRGRAWRLRWKPVKDVAEAA